ncbi:hypothetical protein AAF712_012008 [Marasmius tenuissimus]|uniref:Integrase catalytic domain-containing protein n=1 Tax=Marasmius tenuissimus TaxID=585030 RepID=A0ABR2ZKD4_9AGAR
MSSNDLPPLPPFTSEQMPPNWHRGAEIISTIFIHAQNVLKREIHDLFRIQFHRSMVINDAIPLLVAMEKSIDGREEEEVVVEWLEAVADQFGKLIGQLDDAEKLAVTGEDNLKIDTIEPVTVVRTGKPGRPCKVPNQHLLREAMQPGRRITKTLYASTIKVSTKTLSTYMKEFRIEAKFSTISDEDLDNIIREVQQTRPGTGRRYLAGHLASAGIKVQRERIRKSLARVDPIGQAIREKEATERRDYRVPRPNASWHIDGHHKLIRWGIVIHGIVDGFCRTIVGLQANRNNKASTVLEVFAEAVESWGWPSWVCGDRGGENRRVATVMIVKRGLNRGSFMWGTSMRNTRIERLWVEVGSRFARQWRAFFYRLERLHRLDVKNPSHLWLLHILFLDQIREDIGVFTQEWNSHPISGVGHEQSPKDMRLLGMIKHGVYNDEPSEEGDDDESYNSLAFEEEEADPSERYDWGGESEVEDGEEESESEWEDMTYASIDESCSAQYNHCPIKVPRHQDPFEDQLQLRADFLGSLERMNEVTVPRGWGVYNDEYSPGEGYPLNEEIPVSGKKRGKKLKVTLPPHVWHHRAKRWVRGVILMQASLEENNESE